MDNFIDLLFQYEKFTATVIGALLATTFGILSSVYIEWRKDIKQKKDVCRIVIGELSDILKKVKMLKIAYDNNEAGGICYTKLVRSNTFFYNKQLLVDIFNDEQIEKIENIYSFFEDRDRDMEVVIRTKIYRNEVDKYLINLYWGVIQNDSNEKIRQIEDAIAVLKKKL